MTEDQERIARLRRAGAWRRRRARYLEVLREVYPRWERGDFTSWEAFADDYVWKAVDALEPGEHTGLAEISASWRTWLQAWDGFGIRAEEMIAGVTQHLRGVRRRRSSPLTSTRLTVSADVAAFQAVGLSE